MNAIASLLSHFREGILAQQKNSDQKRWQPICLNCLAKV